MADLVLLCEDDPDLRTVVEYNLRAAGYRVNACERGQDALASAKRERPDLAILDVMLPDLQGTEICRILRAAEATAQLPILMLTARGDEIDRVVGFEVGADDYMVKPFSVRELMLRVQALLRRAATAKPSDPSEILEHGPLKVDLSSRRAFVHGQEVHLTSIEFGLLHILVSRRGRVQSRQRLLVDVWNVSPDIESRTVDTHVKRLRQKLGPAGDLVETVRGTGYRLNDDVAS